MTRTPCRPSDAPPQGLRPLARVAAGVSFVGLFCGGLATGIAAVPPADDVQEFTAADTASDIAAALTSEMAETVRGPFWFSLESRPRWSEGEWMTLSPRAGEAFRQTFPLARVVRQGMDMVRCTAGRADREPHGCPIENGWPIVFVRGFRVLGDGLVLVSLQAKVQFSDRSASGGFTAKLGRDEGEWRIVLVTSQWAT